MTSLPDGLGQRYLAMVRTGLQFLQCVFSSSADLPTEPPNNSKRIMPRAVPGPTAAPVLRPSPAEATIPVVWTALIAFPVWMLLAACGREGTAWPSHPLKIEVGYPPGGGADGLAHVLAYQLGQSLHSEVVVVENRPTSAGIVATSFVARAPRDGYTLLIAATGAVTIAPLLDPSLSYSIERDLCPLALVAETPHVLLVPIESQIDTLDELIVASRRQPGALSYGSLGSGSSAHVLGELFTHAVQLEITHVPYRSSAAAVKDLLGGHVSMMLGTVQATLPAILGGQLRALAVSSEHRAPELPGIPTFAERGLAELTFTSWYGLFTPCGLARDVEERLIAATQEALAHPDIASTLGMQRNTQPVMVGEDFGRFLRLERVRWMRVMPLLLAADETAPTR